MSVSILVVDDEIRYRELYARVLASAGYETQAASCTAEAMEIIRKDYPTLVVTDVRMPGASGIDLLRLAREEHPSLPFLLVTAYPDVRDAVTTLKLGAVDYLAKPVDLDGLLKAVRDAVGGSKEAECEVPREALAGIVAESAAMGRVLRDAYRVAGSDAHILLTGESGVGKEIVALFIHQNSLRRAGPMVAVNCAAIAPSLFASELFGHEKGAFTGAVARRQGRFREADGGTLFLDEIGDMPLEMQASLLRALETNRIKPVGGDKEIEVDYRLVTATNRNLLQQIEAGRFRQDLYYRLNVIAIHIPPLCERQEDILPLARHFLARDQSETKRLSRQAAYALTVYPWPGNVRELANAMEHARLLCQSDVILTEHLPPTLREAVPLSAAGEFKPLPAEKPDVRTLEESEIEAIRLALEKTGGNRTRTAEMLGITRRGLIYKLNRLGLK